MAKRRQQGTVTWHGDDLLLEVKGLAIDEIDKLALEIIAEAKEPIDTGFLAASAYVNSSSGLNTFAETWEPGKYTSRHSGRPESRDKIDSPEPPPKNGAVAGWGAAYALYVENNTDFIYAATVRVASRHRGPR